MADKANSEYKPAIYARLSKEDSRADVSLSIENQIEILEKFCTDMGFPKPKVFFDDDRTGTNFDRDGFKNLYASALAGEIDIIIVKHTDRFGRNAAQAGIYLDEMKDMKIRFISVLQGIDTIDPDSPALDMLPLYLWFDEFQSKTTSNKVRATFKKMALDGKRRAPYAPYGFQKDPEDKYKMIIDPYSSAVIKRIYDMRLHKYSYGSIVNTLNKEGILSPSAYCQEKHGKSTNKKSKDGKWTKDSLNHVFQNVAYRGDTANGMKKVISFKNSKQVRQPLEDWIIVENTHPAIVSREDWQKCYDMIRTLGRVRRTKDSEILPFTGLLVCPDCGYKMRHNHSYYAVKSGEKRRTDNYQCATYATTGKDACSSHYISVKDLNELVCADIRRMASEIMKDENEIRARYISLKLNERKAQASTAERTLKTNNKRISELDKLLQGVVEKSILSGLSNDNLKSMVQKYQAEKQSLIEQSSQLTASIEKQTQTQNDVETFITLMKKYSDITELDRDMAVELIERITVSEGKDKSGESRPKEIVVYYNFIGDVDK